jgi:RNA ligase
LQSLIDSIGKVCYILGMKYKFPHIDHLDQVRPVIQDVDGFILAEKDWGWVANYVQMGPHVFPEVKTEADAIRRECRGLIFSKNGQLISRPLHKFFNIGEREETLSEKVDLTQPHVILEKLDGSMIRPIPMDGAFRLGTKMGITDVSMQAEVWLADHPRYQEYIYWLLSHNVTPIFEWCSRKQRIVIDYPEDRLVLIAVRHNYTGEYTPYGMLQTDAAYYGLDLVKTYPGTVSSMEHLIAETHDMQGQEGWVIRFEDGHMLKLKASEYVTIHKAKENILREKGVIEMLLDEKSDDVKPFLIEEDRRHLEEYETAFWQGVNATVATWAKTDELMRVRYARDQRKDFALTDALTVDPFLKSAIFKAWDNPNYDWREAVLNRVRLSLGGQAKIDETRHLWSNVKWMITDEL